VQLLFAQKKWAVESGESDAALVNWLASIQVVAQEYELDNAEKRNDNQHTKAMLSKVRA